MVNSLSVLSAVLSQPLHSPSMDTCPVKCSICLDIMIQACTLQCGHSFCELCIDNAINRDVRCPRCRQNTNGFGTRNMRLDNLAYSFASQSRLLLESYIKRKRQNKDAMAVRNRARAILCFVLNCEEKALTIGEIEDEWKQLRPDDRSFDNKLIKEMLHTVRTNRAHFNIMDCGEGVRVSMKSMPNRREVP
ncbi:unnamed protein product [Cylicocyclus nassatus]|uniref:RING-type E3 ubiquitin transferase n=1 Tax=Cylicocyclus nassatus TaxID=53992 RepID=A0AA36GVC1_CYLNA|nr:unnamed protein product [Cylicocyclus nassatus]